MFLHKNELILIASAKGFYPYKLTTNKYSEKIATVNAFENWEHRTETQTLNTNSNSQHEHNSGCNLPWENIDFLPLFLLSGFLLNP